LEGGRRTPGERNNDSHQRGKHRESESQGELVEYEIFQSLPSGNGAKPILGDGYWGF